MTEHQKAILLLADGTVFEGRLAGTPGTATGEICFNTGMTGYQEVFTDPSYFGQILIMTSVHIGNYGVMPAETESDSVKISGLVCRRFAHQYSRSMTQQSLQEYFEAQGITGIQEVDTRAIVRHVRDKGAMNAIISSEVTDIDKLKAMLAEVPSMGGLELASKVSTQEPYYYGKEDGRKVAVIDLGIKKSILKCLAERGCYMKVFPAKTPFDEMAAWEPDGYFLSNGPGDPAVMDYAVETTKQILEADKPLFGICLGHQILAEACGISTYKMHHGHRGLNHPVKNVITGQAEITSQNHGFEVNREDIEKSESVEISHVNLNDGTIEGIKVKNKKAFSVQYHPESSPGPHDSRYLFEDFINLIDENVLSSTPESSVKQA